MSYNNAKRLIFQANFADRVACSTWNNGESPPHGRRSNPGFWMDRRKAGV